MYSYKNLIFFKITNCNLLIPRWRSLQPSKENIHFNFVGNFCPFWIRIRIHWPDWMRIQSKTLWECRLIDFLLIISCDQEQTSRVRAAPGWRAPPVRWRWTSAGAPPAPTAGPAPTCGPTTHAPARPASRARAARWTWTSARARPASTAPAQTWWVQFDETLHSKKRLAVFPPPARLVSDIPAREGNTVNLFLQCSNFVIATLNLLLISERCCWPGSVWIYFRIQAWFPIKQIF